MKSSFAAALVFAAVLGSGAVALAQMGQGPHPGHGMGAGQPQTMGDTDRMIGMMRQMMPMMERMRSASPAERERMMNEMRPMMQSVMGMMGGMTGPGHQGHGQTSATATPSTRAFEEANARMHRDMAIAFTGNADVDFVRGMIPHHQGAIDMARVVLQFGTNEQTKKWANEIIAAQEREIAEMREWLARNAR
jgi:uncharacterized protein (DUF305 family)